jgi:hypothetical protein
VTNQPLRSSDRLVITTQLKQGPSHVGVRCQTCEVWVALEDIWIDGTHAPDGTEGQGKTDHTVWEKP